MFELNQRFIVGRMRPVENKQEVDRQGWMAGRQAALLSGRQVEEHTGWIAGRYGVVDPGARRTQRLRTEGNMEYKMY